MRKLSVILFLLCALAQGGWAQTEVGSESALNEALSGESPISIKLTADITLKERMAIPEGKTVTLHLELRLRHCRPAGHYLPRPLSLLCTAHVGVTRPHRECRQLWQSISYRPRRVY